MLIGLFFFLIGGVIVPANLSPIDGGSGILTPFVWGAASLLGIVVMVRGAIEGRGD